MRALDDPTLTVLVLGSTQRGAQATARSLARGGYRVIGAGEGGRLAGRTRYFESLHRIPPPSETADFVQAVQTICSNEQVRAIVPMFDEVQAVLLAYPAAAGRAIVVGPSLHEFESLCDKTGLLETAASARVRCPPSTIVDAGGPRPNLQLPVYVKRVTNAYVGLPAGRPTRVTDRIEYEQLLDRLLGRDEKLLVQQEIDGAQWRYDFVRNDNATAALCSRQLGDYPDRVGQSTVLQFCKTPPVLADLSHRLLDAAGYFGVGSIQWIERDGEWFVHDVNLRMPASVAGMIAAGLDMPRLSVDAELGRGLLRERTTTRRLHYVWLPGELMAMRDALTTGTGRRPSAIAASMLLGAISPRRRLVPFDLTDPLPTFAQVSAALRHPRHAAAA